MRYPIGQRWRVDRSDGRPCFTFVIVGPGTKPDRKLCRVEYDQPNGMTRVDFHAEYTHKHLKKHAVLVE